jgi:hypothetical protein
MGSELETDCGVAHGQTNILKKASFALLWREIFLFAFAGLCLYFVSRESRTWGYWQRCVRRPRFFFGGHRL